MEILAAIAMVFGGMYLMRRTFVIGMICTTIGAIALLSFMNLLGRAEQVPNAIVAGVTTFLSSVGAS